ncbi:MAG: PaaI family thioesterase [Betaproteobacteria bacterium]|nr:MAG: PaaI family thioesterase [Betaproteobacteria bacterium]
MTSPAAKQYGIADPDEVRGMTGLEFVQGLVAGSLPLNSMARTIGYDIVEASAGRVVVTANASADHLNPEGTVHGGVAATLLDTCMGLAVKTMLDKGNGSTTLEIKISFLRPVTKDAGLLRAEGSVLASGRRIGAAEGRLTDSNGRLLAHATTTCLIFARQGNS